MRCNGKLFVGALWIHAYLWTQPVRVYGSRPLSLLHLFDAVKYLQIVAVPWESSGSGKGLVYLISRVNWIIQLDMLAVISGMW